MAPILALEMRGRRDVVHVGAKAALAALIAWLAMIAAGDPVAAMTDGEHTDFCASPLPGGVIASVEDFNEIRLADGRSIRLGSLHLPEGLPDHRSWAETLRTDLAWMLRNAEVKLSGGKNPDRRGRLSAQIVLADGRWVQQLLVADGRVRVMPLPGTADVQDRCAADLLPVEQQARRTRRGLWSTRHFAIRSADRPASLAALADSFQIVEGKVRDVSVTKRAVYLNFGEDWRRDFTVLLDMAARRRFEAIDLDPKSLAGRTIRARGFIELRNGPMISVSLPEQIELVDAQQ